MDRPLLHRLAATAANLVEHVLPSEAPLRQWVLTLVIELRARLAYDGKLLGPVCCRFVDAVLAWYRRKLRVRGLRGGESGAVTAVQRFRATSDSTRTFIRSLSMASTSRTRAAS
jgi:hypothetical protein